MKGSGDFGKSYFSGFMRICISEGHSEYGAVTNPQMSEAWPSKGLFVKYAMSRGRSLIEPFSSLAAFIHLI